MLADLAAPDLLKLLALLLNHIATTNDTLPPSSAEHVAVSVSNAAPAARPPIWHTLTSASRSAINSPASTLTFHARNIPTITLEAYLLRILKYCPTTNHVFLSLLVYFDRMSQLSQDAIHKPFVIDSFNIHRLVIAGITVASKFFSDVFYTNSRYAKVGGLPLPELNQLELQFLLLNDFRLVISSAEMHNYGQQLIAFSNLQSPHIPGEPRTNGDSSNAVGTAAPTGHTRPCDVLGTPAPQSCQSVEDRDETDTETDIDASTDAGSGSSGTDEEPTIRAPRTVCGDAERSSP